MYSVVLMAALTAGTATPSWGWGCHGCHGGWASGCHGCHGLFSGWGCHGCHGGYASYACYGCYGAYYGCYGAYAGCHGGWGCYGSYGCAGAYAWGCSGGYGCYGSSCFGSWGGPVMAPAAEGSSMPSGGSGKTPEPVPPPKKEEKTGALNQARLIVELPADAKLFVDNQLTKATSERRVFNTPILEPGQTYYYVLRAEVIRDGKTETETRRVLIHAGDVVEASFRNLDSVAAAKAEPAAARPEPSGGQ